MHRMAPASSLRPGDVVDLGDGHLTLHRVSFLVGHVVELQGELQQFGTKVAPPADHSLQLNGATDVRVLPTRNDEAALWVELGKALDVAVSEWTERHDDDDDPMPPAWGRVGTEGYEIRAGGGRRYVLHHDPPRAEDG